MSNINQQASVRFASLADYVNRHPVKCCVRHQVLGDAVPTCIHCLTYMRPTDVTFYVYGYRFCLTCALGIDQTYNVTTTE